MCKILYGYPFLISFFNNSQVFTVSQKMSVNVQLFLRLVQGIVSMLLVLTVILLVIFTSVSIGDIFALLLAFIPTGWAIISVRFSPIFLLFSHAYRRNKWNNETACHRYPNRAAFNIR